MLLDYARATARHALDASVPMSAVPPIVPGAFGGLFVTLWNRGVLRGCVGTFEPTHDLVCAVREASRSVLADSRFVANPVTGKELAEISIELSVLSIPQLAAEPTSLARGVHGILIRNANRSGCFLPKVAIEKRWSAEEFLSNCCTMKAGLPADAWRKQETSVYWFTAESFSDADVERQR